MGMGLFFAEAQLDLNSFQFSRHHHHKCQYTHGNTTTRSLILPCVAAPSHPIILLVSVHDLPTKAKVEECVVVKTTLLASGATTASIKLSADTLTQTYCNHGNMRILPWPSRPRFV